MRKEAVLGAGGTCVPVGGGARQGGKATPNLSHRSYLPGIVTCVGAEDGSWRRLGDRRCGAEKAGPRLAWGGRAGAQCQETGLAVSVWAELTGTAVPTWESLGRVEQDGALMLSGVGASPLPRRYLRASRSSSAR